MVMISRPAVNKEEPNEAPVCTVVQYEARYQKGQNNDPSSPVV